MCSQSYESHLMEAPVQTVTSHGSASADSHISWKHQCRQPHLMEAPVQTATSHGSTSADSHISWKRQCRQSHLMEAPVQTATSHDAMWTITFNNGYSSASGRLWLNQYCHLITNHSIRWLYSCDKSSYISSIDSKCHVVVLKFTEQNVNNQTLTQVSQLYVHVFFCLKGNQVITKYAHWW